MVISPAVPAPKPGDPITAKWASDLAAAVNSCANPAARVGEVSTPFGKASPAPGLPMLGASRMPQPFDVALFRDEGESADTLYIWLPDLGADYVVYKGKPLGAAPGQTIGDANTAWVEVGSVASGAAHYIYLVPHAASSGEVDGWEITDTATAWDAEGGGTGDELPHVLLAYYNIAADGTVPAAGTDDKWPSGQNGLVQCRHGTIVLGGTTTNTTDTTVADESSSNTQNRSVDEREEDGALQIHDFDETLPSGTGIRKVELKAVADAETGGRKLQLVDPDDNADFQNKWMIPLREAGTGGREIKWACIGGEVCLPVPSFTASVASGTGTPGVVVTKGGTECAPTVDLAFSGLKGDNGDDGCSPEISVTVLEPGSTQGGEAGGFLVAIQNYERSGGQCVAVGQLLTFVVKNGTKGDDGDRGADGCTPTVTACSVPTEHGDCAYIITPCGEGATPITVYHGRNGTDGCAPVVTPGSGNVACYIQPRRMGANGCENDGSAIPVYNGTPGAGLSGTFLVPPLSLAVTTAGLTVTAGTVTYTNGVQTATGTTSATVETTTC